MEASTVEKGFEPEAQQAATSQGENPLGDLELSPEEAGEEAADAARKEGLEELDVERARLDAEEAARERLEQAEAPEVDGSGEDAEPPPHQIIVRGAAGSRPKWAGKQPGMTILKLTGGKFAVDGGFRKGERIKFEGEALVISEGSRDRLDKETMTVSDSVQEHEAKILDFDLLGEEG